MNAPIVVFGYNRLAHLKRCLESLEIACQKVTEKTDLYIFADGYKSEKDRQDVLEVQKFVAGYQSACFQNVYPVLAERNKGLAASVISGVSEIIKRYGSVIVVEDDLVVAAEFVRFMNDAIEAFREDNRVWSIGGWVPQLQSVSNLKEDVFLSYRAECWGWATWQDRWQKVDWDVKNYKKFRYSFKQRRRFSRGGSDMPQMLDAQMEGRIHSWAIRWAYSENVQDMLTVCPKYSLVQNGGFDGSGTNCHEKEAEKELCQGFSPKIDKDIVLDQAVVKEYKRVISGTFMVRQRRNLKSFLHRIRYDIGHR